MALIGCFAENLLALDQRNPKRKRGFSVFLAYVSGYDNAPFCTSNIQPTVGCRCLDHAPTSLAWPQAPFALDFAGNCVTLVGKETWEGPLLGSRILRNRVSDGTRLTATMSVTAQPRGSPLRTNPSAIAATSSTTASGSCGTTPPARRPARPKDCRNRISITAP